MNIVNGLRWRCRSLWIHTSRIMGSSILLRGLLAFLGCVLLAVVVFFVSLPGRWAGIVSNAAIYDARVVNPRVASSLPLFNPLNTTLGILRMQKTGTGTLTVSVEYWLQEIERLAVLRECERRLCGEMVMEVGDRCGGRTCESISVSSCRRNTIPVLTSVTGPVRGGVWCCNNMGSLEDVGNKRFPNQDCWSKMSGCVKLARGVFGDSEEDCAILHNHHGDYLDVLHALEVLGVGRDVMELVTVVRDPVERVISEYKHLEIVKEMEADMVWDYSIPDELNLETYLNCEECVRGTRNRQARMLAGLGQKSFKDLPADDLQLAEMAIQTLDKMFFVGVLEDMDAGGGYALLAAQLNLPPSQFLLYYRNEATQTATTENLRRFKPSKEQWEKIAKMNIADILVFEHAKALLQARIQHARNNPYLYQAIQNLNTPKRGTEPSPSPILN